MLELPNSGTGDGAVIDNERTSDIISIAFIVIVALAADGVLSLLFVNRR